MLKVIQINLQCEIKEEIKMFTGKEIYILFEIERKLVIISK
jgi:hypothetical protein